MQYNFTCSLIDNLYINRLDIIWVLTVAFKIRIFYNLNSSQDIFATNVVAKDPYTQRTVELIDQRG